MKNMSFGDFCEITRQNIETGVMQIPKQLSMLDMAVMYAVGRIGERKGYPCNITDEEICAEIMKFTDESIYDKDEGWFYDAQDADFVDVKDD